MEAQNIARFKPAEKSDTVSFPDRAALAEFDADIAPVYRLGEGDLIQVQVWGRPELSAKHVLGPDGRISVPLAGHLALAAMTREEATDTIVRSLRKYYQRPAVSLSVEQYTANRITVLGRVQTPGAINFDHPPSLLETLARAGALPVIDKQSRPTRCAVFRGRDRVIWVDLKPLMSRADMAYNLRLKPGDLVYLPDSNDTSVYVLGAVHRPGAYRLTSDMSVLEALAQAGGPNEDGAPQEMMIYRASQQALERIPLNALATGLRTGNFALEDGDVIYVPKSGIADVGYTLRQLLPGLSFMTFGIGVSAPAGK